MPEPAPPRRSFQFRLRTLLIGVTLLAIVCGYLAWQRKVQLAEAMALSRIHSLGGFALFASPPNYSSPLTIYLPVDTTQEDRNLIHKAYPNVDTWAFRGHLFGTDGRLQLQNVEVFRFAGESDR
jgi:hypothetical protein